LIQKPFHLIQTFQMLKKGLETQNKDSHANWKYNLGIGIALAIVDVTLAGLYYAYSRSEFGFHENLAEQHNDTTTESNDITGNLQELLRNSTKQIERALQNQSRAIGSEQLHLDKRTDGAGFASTLPIIVTIGGIVAVAWWVLVCWRRERQWREEREKRQIELQRQENNAIQPPEAAPSSLDAG
jgi:hypothetical protein